MHEGVTQAAQETTVLLPPQAKLVVDTELTAVLVLL
jgi:hypothetical protein